MAGALRRPATPAGPAVAKTPARAVGPVGGRPARPARGPGRRRTRAGPAGPGRPGGHPGDEPVPPPGPGAPIVVLVGGYGSASGRASALELDTAASATPAGRRGPVLLRRWTAPGTGDLDGCRSRATASTTPGRTSGAGEPSAPCSRTSAAPTPACRSTWWPTRRAVVAGGAGRAPPPPRGRAPRDARLPHRGHGPGHGQRRGAPPRGAGAGGAERRTAASTGAPRRRSSWPRTRPSSRRWPAAGSRTGSGSPPWPPRVTWWCPPSTAACRGDQRPRPLRRVRRPHRPPRRSGHHPGGGPGPRRPRPHVPGRPGLVRAAFASAAEDGGGSGSRSPAACPCRGGGRDQGPVHWSVATARWRTASISRYRHPTVARRALGGAVGQPLGGTVAPVVTLRQLLEAGVHFGHQTRRWNPKMKRFIHGERNGIYIIDLQQTLGASRWPTPSCATSSPTAATSSSSAPRSRPRTRRRSPRPSAAACRTSTSAGSAACSPTSRPSAARRR